MELHIYQETEALSQALAGWIVRHIQETLQQRPRFCWALTGGNSPRRLYEILSEAPYRQQVPWEKLHIFWGDERAVPFSDERNNARMTYETLLNKVPVPAGQVHAMQTDIDPQQSAMQYERLLESYFGREGRSFDLVLNGMGDDGHTLSLFPGTVAVRERQRLAMAYYLAAQDMYRITLTAPVVNRAEKVVFLCFGEKKAHALQQVLEGAPNADLYPSQLIHPASGALHWFVDQAAASQLRDAAN